MGFNRDDPYNELPLLPPPVDLESKNILKALVNTSRALAELKQAGELIPNQAVLINTIPLLEAQSSSEIENIVTTTDRLFQSASAEEEATDPATKEALRYRTALREGYQALHERPICTNTAISICRTIRNTDEGIRKTPGTKLKNPVTEEIVYTPPEGESVIREKLANWEVFINETPALDPLVRMAVMHYQFEAIHPFSDGNGRTGRILNILYLMQEGILSLPVLYLSRFIIKNKNEYYQCLREVTENQAWEAWIIYMLKALEETANWTAGKIKTIRRLLRHTRDYLKRKTPRIYTRELVELIFTLPYCRIQNITSAGLAKRQTASVYLKQLVGLGVLREIKVGREKLFLHPKFLKLLLEDSNDYVPYFEAPSGQK